MISVSVTAASVRISDESIVLLHSKAISFCHASRVIFPFKDQQCDCKCRPGNCRGKSMLCPDH